MTQINFLSIWSHLFVSIVSEGEGSLLDVSFERWYFIIMRVLKAQKHTFYNAINIIHIPPQKQVIKSKKSKESQDKNPKGVEI